MTAAPDSLLDLPGLVAGIRWRRRTWMGLALVGLVLGALVAVFLQPHTAATRILVVHEDETLGGGSGILMETDVALLETTNIAAAAVDRLDLPDRPDRFLRTFAGEGITDNVLEISVSAPTDADAVTRAGAIADAFIADHLRRTEEAAGAEARALLDRRATAERDLEALNDQIADVRADPGDPVDAAAQLDSLYARRAALADQIQEFGQRASDSDVGAPRVAAGTRIVDPARVTSPSRLMSVAVNSATGLVLGLGLGLAVAAVATLVRDRPILRRDIAAQLGASVIVQLARPRRGPARLVRRSRAQKELERAGATLARLVRDAPGRMSLLEIGCPASAAQLAHAVVDELAPEVPVEIVDELPGDHLARAAARRRPPAAVDAPPAVVDAPEADAAPAAEPDADATAPDATAPDATDADATDADAPAPDDAAADATDADATDADATDADATDADATDAADADVADADVADADVADADVADADVADATDADDDATDDATDADAKSADADVEPDGDAPDLADADARPADSAADVTPAEVGPAPVDAAPVVAEDPAAVATPPRTLGVGSVAPGATCVDLDRLGTETVLVVRAGHAGTAWLHTVARQLADQQVAVLGIVLVHPDPRDDTDGTLWDALHTALRGRARPVPAVVPGSVALRTGTALPPKEVQNHQVRPAMPDHTAVEVSS